MVAKLAFEVSPADAGAVGQMFDARPPLAPHDPAIASTTSAGAGWARRAARRALAQSREPSCRRVEQARERRQQIAVHPPSTVVRRQERIADVPERVSSAAAVIGVRRRTPITSTAPVGATAVGVVIWPTRSAGGCRPRRSTEIAARTGHQG